MTSPFVAGSSPIYVPKCRYFGKNLECYANAMIKKKKGDKAKGYFYVGMSFFLKTQIAAAIINSETTMIKAKSPTLNTVSNIAAE